MTLPSAQTLGLFLLAAAVLIAIPGPNHLYIVSRSVAAGRRAGMTAGVGIELGTLAHIAFAAVGLSYLVAASASAFAVVRYAGAAYLFYLAYRALRSSDTSAVPVTGGRPEPLVRELRRGFLVNLLNPKVILFFVAFLPQFLHPERGAVWSQVLVLGLLLISLGVGSNLLYAVCAAAVAQALRRRSRERDRFTGAGRYAQAGIYLLLGALTLTTRPHPR